MLDLIDGAKIVQAMAPTTEGAAAVTADHIEMIEAHRVWTIINVVAATTKTTFTPQVAQDVTGTGSSAITGGAKWWVNTNCTTLDRMVATTGSTDHPNSTAYTLVDNALSAQIVCCYDPAAASSSHTHFAMTQSTNTAANVGRISMTYILDTRNKGYQAIIATSGTT